MKKLLFYVSFGCISLVGGLSAQPQLIHDGYQKIECPLKAISHSDVHHGQHNRPKKYLFEGTSTNWSGYAALTSLTRPTVGSVLAVSGSWIVPQLTASRSPNTYSSI